MEEEVITEVELLPCSELLLNADQQIERMKEQVRLLRDALENLSHFSVGCMCGRSEWCEGCTPNSGVDRMRKIARTALKQTKGN